VAAQILDGKETSKALRAEVAEGVAAFTAQTGKPPGLAAVLVGDDPASATYVKMKQKACEKAGIFSEKFEFPAEATTQEVRQRVSELAFSPTFHAILVQHPVPASVDEAAVLEQIPPGKDVDGMTTASLGRLYAGQGAFVSCTAMGIMELLSRYGIDVQGKEAVVVGRSIIIGKPIASLLLNANATVTVCHSRTRDLAEVTRRADILVVAVGKPEYVTGDMIREGAVVIDVGYNKVEGRSGDVGDVEFESASAKASWITPVPGGCGPMTIAALLKNTLTAAGRSRERHSCGEGTASAA
jgi:methylenetetrahydrofolate dehydrogenase (NADP+)/methenyltetrahydrofolate cyclohydrolase